MSLMLSSVVALFCCNSGEADGSETIFDLKKITFLLKS
jgi:hypothetical protein